MAIEEIWEKAERKLGLLSEKQLREASGSLVEIQQNGLNFYAEFTAGTIFLCFDFPYFNDKKRLAEFKNAVDKVISKYTEKMKVQTYDSGIFIYNSRSSPILDIYFGKAAEDTPVGICYSKEGTAILKEILKTADEKAVQALEEKLKQLK